MPALIRTALPGDLDSIRKLETEIALYHNTLRPDLYRSHPGLMTEEYYQNILSDPDRFSYVAVNENGEVNGVALCSLKRADNSYCYRSFLRMYIHLLCVKEDCQRQGVGTLLMEAVRRKAMELGCYALELGVWQCNEKALAFYRGFGFDLQVSRMEMLLPGKEVDITNTWLQTPRLILRPWQESDLNDFYAYASVPGVGEMAGWPHHESIDVSRMILKDFMESKNVFAIQHAETGKVIGSFGLHSSWASNLPEFAGKKIREIGYVLAKEYWGQGLMPEAVRAVIAYCFNALRLDLITVAHFTDNDQSRRVIEKSGFQFHSDGVFNAELLGRQLPEKKYILPNPRG